MTDLMTVELTKWPRLVVLGDNVTPQQAMEILIRTDNLMFMGNDKEYCTLCKEYLRGDVADYESGDDVDEYLEGINASVGYIPLNYLGNSQIVSCWVGGPHGWCDWQGNIGCSNYNIGKWPGVQEVYEDWVSIAQAFPYLNLKCQLINDEGEGDIAVEFWVRDGAVEVPWPRPLGRVREPGALLQPLEEPDYMAQLDKVFGTENDAECGCTYEQYCKAIDYVRSIAAMDTTHIVP